MDVFVKLFARDIDKLIFEVESYKNEEYLWQVAGDIKNSSGNLCLHLIGNLNYFIGAIIGDSGYVRQREAEFSDKNIPRDKLLDSLKKTRKIVIDSLRKMDRAKLSEYYPIEVFGEKMTYEFFIIHLVAHLNYHLGQINYLRRITEY